MRDVEIYAAEDARRKEEAELENRADNLIQQAEFAAKKLGREDKRRMQELVKELRRARKAKDRAAVQRACEEIERALAAAGQTIWNSDAQPERRTGGYDAALRARRFRGQKVTLRKVKSAICPAETVEKLICRLQLRDIIEKQWTQKGGIGAVRLHHSQSVRAERRSERKVPRRILRPVPHAAQAARTGRSFDAQLRSDLSGNPARGALGAGGGAGRGALPDASVQKARLRGLRAAGIRGRHDVALAYHKCLDNWADDRSAASLAEARLASPQLPQRPPRGIRKSAPRLKRGCAKSTRLNRSLRRSRRAREQHRPDARRAVLLWRRLLVGIAARCGGRLGPVHLLDGRLRRPARRRSPQPVQSAQAVSRAAGLRGDVPRTR